MVKPPATPYNFAVINLAFSTNAFKKNTLAEAIDSIASIGYGGVELMADLHHANPTTFDATAQRAANFVLNLHLRPNRQQRQRLHLFLRRRHLSSHLDRR